MSGLTPAYRAETRAVIMAADGGAIAGKLLADQVQLIASRATARRVVDRLRLDSDSDLTETVRTLSCPNCGAKVEITSDRHASACPFCATPVVTDTGTTRLIKPQGVLPFVITEAQAKAALEDWLGGLWFAPSGLTAYARRGKEMSGVYSPFWTFDANTRSRYSGARGDWYYETVWVTREINGRQQRVAEQAGERVRLGAEAGPHAVAHGDGQADGGHHDGHHPVLEQGGRPGHA